MLLTINRNLCTSNPRPILERPPIALIVFPLLALDALQMGHELVAQLVEAAAGLGVDLVLPG
jgi:hypothetical protein